MTDKKYKEYIDEFIVKYYKRLMDTAEARCKNTEWDASDVFTEVIIFLYDNKNKIQEIKKNKAKEERNSKEDPLLLYACALIRNNIFWSANNKASNFQGKYLIKDNIQPETVEDSYSDSSYQSEDLKLKKEIYFQVIDNELDMVEKKMYELLYKDEMLIKDIIELIPGTSYYSLSKIIKDMEDNITKKCKEYYLYEQQTSKERRKYSGTTTS